MDEEVKKYINDLGFDALVAEKLIEIVKISFEAGKDEGAAEIERLKKIISEMEDREEGDRIERDLMT